MNSASAEDPATARDRDSEGRARSARPRDGLGRPLPYGSTEGVARQPEGVVRTPRETVAEAQTLLGEGKPFHAHEVFEDAWKSGPERERELWRGLAQLAVGLTHAARGNGTGAVRLLLRGADRIQEWAAEHAEPCPYGIEVAALAAWARDLAAEVEGKAEGDGGTVDARARAPRLTRAAS